MQEVEAEQQVILESSAFQRALASYIDDNKPDPIMRRQLEAWKLEWTTTDIENAEGNERSKNGGGGDFKQVEAAAPAFDSSKANVIRGTLTIQGEYVSVVLRMECSWNHPDKESDDVKMSDGLFTFSCAVDSAKILDKTSSEDEDKVDRKIRKKMIQRLKQDSYIAKLLALDKPQQPSAFDPYLAKAKIHVHQARNILEERVDVSETIAEAIRRAIWSSAESSLDVIEVMLALPSLPGSSHKNTIEKTTPLANRAKLRLLEDAMLDECEKEGEGELIQELSIVDQKRWDDRNKDDSKETTQSGRKKMKSKR